MLRKWFTCKHDMMCVFRILFKFFLIIQSTFLHLSSADKKMKVMKNEEKEVCGGGMSHQDKDELF